MDIYERIKQDHDKQRELMEKIMKTSGDSAERQELFERFKTEAVAHANAKEQVFYSELMEDQETQEQTRHSVNEHKEADDLIEELSEMDMSSSSWLTKFKELKEDLEHHMDEEEKDVFSMAHDVISDAEAEQMTGKFDTRKQDEKQAA